MIFKKKKSKKRRIFLNRWWRIGALLIVLLLFFLIVSVFKDLPNPKKLSSGEYPESSQILDRNGKLLYEIFTDKERTSVTLNEVPEKLIKATLAIEDNNFYNHGGFDFKGILRGLFRTVFQNRLQGGSTLTQQLVKNALLTPERTWKRKIKEAVLTIATESLYNKDQILEMYFNQTPYGGTMWGVESAARVIFNKDVKDLDLAESALIAGLPASPTNYSPFAHPDAAKKRQELVLKRMEELNYINTQEYEAAVNEKLNYNLSKNSILAPHFVFYVKEQLIKKYGIQKVTEGGLKVWTTLDLDLQNYAQNTVKTEIDKLAKLKVTNGAAMITEAKTGQILAMVGSKDYFDNEIDGKYNVTTALRQPGSSIKPLNYAVGIETGKVTAASIFDDDPTCFQVSGQKNYCPSNYGGNYHGIQTLRNSLASSLNIPAVKMLQLNGLETFVASASAMGISTYRDASDYGLSLTLGGGEVYMTDMTTAFGVFANMGIKQKLVSILKVTDKNNQVLEQNSYVPGERVLSAETSYIISNILSDDGARSMVFGSGSMLNIKKHPEVAVKTGTTNDMKDNWTVGYTPDNVVAVWVGNNDDTKMGALVSGTTGAAPIWNKIMTKVLENKAVKNFSKPEGVLTMNVCNLTGFLVPDEGCDSHNELFKKEFVPTQKISLNNSILIDKTTGKEVGVGESNPNAEWQSHPSVQDISGVWYCLDCPKNESNN
ncbi:MAG: PBP1A family penicillin-binding protein [Candidatus Shapirobacteria bacterium]|jgi:1A family penicillin-binding protein